jgi:hypothetical protein
MCHVVIREQNNLNKNPLARSPGALCTVPLECNNWRCGRTSPASPQARERHEVCLAASLLKISPSFRPRQWVADRAAYDELNKGVIRFHYVLLRKVFYVTLAWGGDLTTAVQAHYPTQVDRNAASVACVSSRLEHRCFSGAFASSKGSVALPRAEWKSNQASLCSNTPVALRCCKH